MPRYVAFLRAINVGGHTVTMEHLRALFEELGLVKVESFIASGNLIFESRSRAVATLAARIERRLETALGYEVATMLRTDAEVAAIARREVFAVPELATAKALNVALLPRAAPPAAQRALDALRTELDEFRVSGSEVYRLCRERQSQSTFSGARFEKLMGMPATWRGLKTIQRLAAKYPGGSAPD